MKWPLILLISTSYAWSKCEEITVKSDKTEYKVCRLHTDYGYLSKDCKSVQDCFPVKGKKVEILPYQNPVFGLCKKIGGEGIFAEVKREQQSDSDSFCLLKGKIVDMESLVKSIK